MRHVLVLAALATSLAVASTASAADPVAHSGRLAGSFDVVPGPDGPTAAQRAMLDLQIAQYEVDHPAAPTSRQLYRFFPQGGTLWQDLFVNNFTDQDGNQTNGTSYDFDCTEFAYDGHQGHDSLVRSFTEKRIGVPVFAALAGTVVAAHDGEFDERKVANPANTANYVIVDDGGGQRSLYWHLRNGSVLVAVNQHVVAGQQLGLTASSGYSNWPHLHFESDENGVWYEPHSGACGPSTSGWAAGHQTPIRRDAFFVRDFTFSPNAFSNDYPDDNAVRTGTFYTNNTQLHIRVELGNAQTASTYAIRFRFPNGSSAGGFSGTLSGGTRYSSYWWDAVFNPSMNVVGRWHMDLDINGINILNNVGWDVLCSSCGQSRGPNALNGLAFDPAAPVNGDVLFCRVQTSPIFEHPDYHVVQYQYVWKVNGNPVRTNTFAGLADALASDQVLSGRAITCEVTPLDTGTSSIAGPMSSATVTVGAGPTAATLRTLTATRTSHGTLVRWRTGIESNLLGFNVYRAGVRMNRTLISSVFGGAVHGHAYSWLDRGAPQRRGLRYRLQGVALDGKLRWLGSTAVDA